VNQLENAAKPEGEATFKEVLPHIDTVWFFPHAEKGIVTWRGTAEIKDDEALDVPHLFIVSERAGDEPGTMERYYVQFQKAIDRAVPIDMAPQMEKAKKRLTGVADMLRDLPLQINDRIAQNLGYAPRVNHTPAEVATRAMAAIDENKKLLADGEKRIMALKADYGHLMKIETGGFATGAQRLDEMKMKISGLPGKVDKILHQKDEVLEDVRSQTKKVLDGLNPQIVEKYGLDVDTLIGYKEEPGDPWQESGMRFLDDCRDRLVHDPEMMSAFRSLNFRP
jgi:hypothetical protein